MIKILVLDFTMIVIS